MRDVLDLPKKLKNLGERSDDLLKPLPEMQTSVLCGTHDRKESPASGEDLASSREAR